LKKKLNQFKNPSWLKQLALRRRLRVRIRLKNKLTARQGEKIKFMHHLGVCVGNLYGYTLRFR